jgi:hypothetical protein
LLMGAFHPGAVSRLLTKRLGDLHLARHLKHFILIARL